LISNTEDHVNVLRNWLEKINSSAWFAYPAVLLLQLKTIWGIWRWRDMSAGDTGYYFGMAQRWFTTGRGPLTQSPLYTLFYGALMHVSQDAFRVTTLHRLILVFVLAILVLALMRRLLPPGLAWATAAWWVVLPIDFNSLYEVHLFVVVPILLAVLCALWIPGPWGRGWCFALLLIAAILARNEYVPSALLFAGACAAREWLRARKGEPGARGWTGAYVIPAALACLLICFFYFRRSEQNWPRALAAKHTLSVCQPYAFGYQQRHSDWQGSPWTGCRQLMTRDFGLQRPSLIEALRRNPPAVLEHFWWNFELIPNGLQILLLNGMTGNVDPDYIPVNRYSLALPASLLIGLVVLIGGWFLYQDWRYWWKTSLKDRAWAWIAMICVACVSPMIILTQRPRPSYLLPLGIFLRAAIAMCAWAFARLGRGSKRERRGPQFRWLAPLAPVAFVLLLLFAPEYYSITRVPQTLATYYETLAPFRQWIDRPDAGLVTADRAGDLCRFISPNGTCRALDFPDLRGEVTAEKPLSRVLDERNATVFFADSPILNDPAARDFVNRATSDGWRLIAQRHDSIENWDLLVKPGNARSIVAASAR
jgi:hypothetical protein